MVQSPEGRIRDIVFLYIKKKKEKQHNLNSGSTGALSRSLKFLLLMWDKHKQPVESQGPRLRKTPPPALVDLWHLSFPFIVSGVRVPLLSILITLSHLSPACASLPGSPFGHPPSHLLKSIFIWCQCPTAICPRFSPLLIALQKQIFTTPVVKCVHVFLYVCVFHC